MACYVCLQEKRGSYPKSICKEKENDYGQIEHSAQNTECLIDNLEPDEPTLEPSAHNRGRMLPTLVCVQTHIKTKGGETHGEAGGFEKIW